MSADGTLIVLYTAARESRRQEPFRRGHRPVAFDTLRSVRRFLAGLLVGAFLALVGVQSAHAHDSSAAPVDSCAVCVLAHQAQRHAPAAAPAVVTVHSWTPLQAGAESFSGAAPVVAADARAPPSAS